MSEADPLSVARNDGRTVLTEAEAKTMLQSAGIETPPFAVVSDADEAAAAADDIGFPVVVKISSPAVTHKSEWGHGAGVALNLDSPEAVHDAVERIFEIANEEAIDANVLVEKALDVDAGTEVIVGGLRDPSFGSVVLVGLGGVFTEVYEDTSHRLAPIDHAEARSAIEELTAARLLNGYRGSEPADMSALADVVKTVGDFVAEHADIKEVDVNPVLATSEGAIALDALVMLDATDQ